MSSTVNTEPITQTGNKQKHGLGSGTSAHGCKSANIVPTVHGVSLSSNPIPSNPALHSAFTLTPGPLDNFSSLVETSTSCTTGATDVWYFVQGVNSKTKPVQSQPLKNNKVSKSSQVLKNLHFQHVNCASMCTMLIFFLQDSVTILDCKDNDWTSWKNVEGQTDTIHNHLKKAHGKYWHEVVLLKQLKGWTTFGTSNKASPAAE